MPGFWFWVGVGCAASAVCGFVLMRFAAPRLPKFRIVDHAVAPAAGETADPALLAEPVAAAPAGGPEGARTPRAQPPGRAPARTPKAPEPPARAPARAPTARRHAAAARPATAAARRTATPRAPEPTVPEPSPVQLILWSRQVTAGERKMSLATDGCRVTWDRTCRHGHPTWLVHLGYLESTRVPLDRHTPR